MKITFRKIPKTNNLDQVTFLKSLRKDINEQGITFAEASSILQRYPEVPKQMDEWDWIGVSNALRKCYRSVVILFQIAMMVKKGMLDVDLLYGYHYSEICRWWIDKLEYLVQWSGTGLDLAAGFDAHEVGYLVPVVRKLILKLDEAHERFGGDTGDRILEELRYESIRCQFLGNISKYDLGSKHYSGKYVEAVPHNYPVL